jgi:hypothetical protein
MVLDSILIAATFLKYRARAVLEVGRDEAEWHPVSFRKAPKPSLCLLTIAKSSRHLFSRFETIPLLFLAV